MMKLTALSCFVLFFLDPSYSAINEREYPPMAFSFDPTPYPRLQQQRRRLRRHNNNREGTAFRLPNRVKPPRRHGSSSSKADDDYSYAIDLQADNNLQQQKWSSRSGKSDLTDFYATSTEMFGDELQSISYESNITIEEVSSSGGGSNSKETSTSSKRKRRSKAFSSKSSKGRSDAKKGSGKKGNTQSEKSYFYSGGAKSNQKSNNEATGVSKSKKAKSNSNLSGEVGTTATKSTKSKSNSKSHSSFKTRSFADDEKLTSFPTFESTLSGAPASVPTIVFGSQTLVPSSSSNLNDEQEQQQLEVESVTSTDSDVNEQLSRTEQPTSSPAQAGSQAPPAVGGTLSDEAPVPTAELITSTKSAPTVQPTTSSTEVRTGSVAPSSPLLMQENAARNSYTATKEGSDIVVIAIVISFVGVLATTVWIVIFGKNASMDKIIEIIWSGKGADRSLLQETNRLLQDRSRASTPRSDGLQ